jgi:hypothetical protein
MSLEVDMLNVSNGDARCETPTTTAEMASPDGSNIHHLSTATPAMTKNGSSTSPVRKAGKNRAFRS